jgi:uncharacterized protein (DUF427 family)
MPRAIWNGAVIATSGIRIVVEGNPGFAPHAANREHLRESKTRTVRSWKGPANHSKRAC